MDNTEIDRRILLVEDDEDLRNAISLELEASGYEVVETGNGIEALKHLEGSACGHSEVNLVITDIVMPELSGLELIEQIKLKKPALPIIVISGFINTVTVQSLSRLGVSAILEKPFTPSNLQKEINALVSTPG